TGDSIIYTDNKSIKRVISNHIEMDIDEYIRLLFTGNYRIAIKESNERRTGDSIIYTDNKSIKRVISNHIEIDIVENIRLLFTGSYRIAIKESIERRTGDSIIYTERKMRLINKKLHIKLHNKNIKRK
ncbi:MAG: hypothetical protein HXX18_08070, partial [Bacteroidetes bacterium]|nr:hypothetical protein [Bacteroidota bacterium]